MFTLPNDFDHDDFVGGFLTEIGVGIGNISLKFGRIGPPGLPPSTAVIIHGNFCCVRGEFRCSGRAAAPETAVGLMAFLNADVSAIECDEQYALRIQFGNMGYICVPQDQDDFETFTIAVPGKMMIIG